MQRERFFEQYGISTWLYKNRDLEEALTRIAGAGFRQVEIWAWGAHLDPRLCPDLAEAKGLLQRLGLRVHTLHSPANRELRIGDPDPALRQGWMEAIGPCMDYAAELGAVGVVVHVGSLRESLEPPAYEEGCRAVEEFIRQLGERGRALGVKVLLENIPDYVFPRLGTSLQELTRLFPDPEFGFCLDVGHSVLNGVPIAQEAAAAGPRLLSIHASNNGGQADNHWPLDRGVLNWSQVEGALAAADYRHPLMLEISGGDDPDGMLKQLETLWERL